MDSPGASRRDADWGDRDGRAPRFQLHGSGLGGGSFQPAHMQNLVLAQRLNLRFADGDHGNGFADGVEHFQAVARLLSRPALMMLDHGRHVATSPWRSLYCGRSVRRETFVNSSYFMSSWPDRG